jgi:uncharacterized Zn finger protein
MILKYGSLALILSRFKWLAPKSIEPSQVATIPAMLIKKGGDFPAFWHKQNSFIEVMEDFYVRMRKAALKGV